MIHDRVRTMIHYSLTPPVTFLSLAQCNSLFCHALFSWASIYCCCSCLRFSSFASFVESFVGQKSRGRLSLLVVRGWRSERRAVKIKKKFSGVRGALQVSFIDFFVWYTLSSSPSTSRYIVSTRQTIFFRYQILHN